MSATADGAVSRRGFLKLAAAGAAATAIGPTGQASAFDWSDAASATTMSPATYLAREVTDIVGGETVPPGTSTPEAMAESWWRTGKYARQHDNTMLQTMWNRLEDSHTIAMVQAKTAALQAMQDGKPQEDVVADAEAAVEDYYAIIQQNLINHWEVQLDKLVTAYEEFDAHDAVDEPAQFAGVSIYVDFYDDYSSEDAVTNAIVPPTTTTRSVDLVNGDSIDLTYIDFAVPDQLDRMTATGQVDLISTSIEMDTNSDVTFNGDWDMYARWSIPPTHLDGVETSRSVNWSYFDPEEYPVDYEAAQDDIDDEDGSFGGYRTLNQYMVLYDGVGQQVAQMKANASNWVENAYGEVQAGEMDVEELAANSPMVLADQWASDYEDTGHLAYAAADLATLGLSFDSDNRMVFELEDGTELEGTIYMSESSFEFEVGTTIEPSNEDNGEFYVAADTTTMQRELPSEEYRAAIDGGELKLNVAPIEDTEYLLSTTAGEEVSVAANAFSIDEDDDANSDVELIENAESVVVDLADDLEETITEVDSILHLQAGDDEAMVMELTEPFTILEAYDVESGDEVDVVSGEGYNPGTSSVDLSWTDDYLEMRDNTDDYVSASSGGGGGISFPGLGNIGIPGSGLGLIGSALQLAILAAAAYLGYDVFLSDS